MNSLSDAARRYFETGGLGILIDDVGLTRYASERIAEVYYSARLDDHLGVTLDCQRVLAPAYHRGSRTGVDLRPAAACRVLRSAIHS